MRGGGGTAAAHGCAMQATRAAQTAAARAAQTELVAQLNAESIDYVVNGPNNRSGGLTECWLSVRPGSYDHKRHHKLKQDGMPQPDAQLRVWDFLLVREDGSSVRLHPQWGNTHVDALAGKGHEVTQILFYRLGRQRGPRHLR